MMGRTLKSQLTLITLLPMLITLLFVSALVTQEFISKIDDEIEVRAHDIAAQASMMSEFYLYTGDVDGLKEVTRSIMRIDGLRYVKFIDSSGQLLMQHGHSQNNNTQHFVFPIYGSAIEIDDFEESSTTQQKEQLGTLELGLSIDETSARRYETYQRLLFISLTSLLLGILLILFFTRALNTAIGNLASAAKKIQQGKLHTRCEENGSGELLEFQKVFNTMAASFEESEIKMKAKVDAATASLLLTIDELSQKNIELDKSRQATISLERSKAISDERERIMKDMHDGIGGQLITSLALLEQEKDSQLKDNIHQIISDCLDDLRLIINSLNIANDGLAALLADFKFRMNKKLDQMHIKLVWRVNDIADNIHIQPQMSLHLLRILQEAFTNILKHAKATEIVFELTDEGEFIQLLIVDNGEFDPDCLGSNGIGLTNMQSRAKFLDAELSIKQAYTGGCAVKLKLAKSQINIDTPND